MKSFKKIVFFSVCIILLLTLSFPVFAIGFKAEDKYDSVFVITSGNSLGSGFSVGENCIISNAHVILNQKDVQVTTYDGKKYNANVFCIDTALDIAVLQIDNVKLPYLTVEDYNSLAVGSDVYTIGAPNSMSYTLTKGVLSAKDRQLGNYKYIQLDAAINKGNSGGPLLNDNGNVIGVNTLKVGETEGIGLAIPMTTVCEFLKTNGINIDVSGNVVGNIEKNNLSSTQAVDSTVSKQVQSNKSEIWQWIFIGIGGFIVLVVTSIIMVFIYKNRTIKPKLDNTDRTDFDIDILE